MYLGDYTFMIAQNQPRTEIIVFDIRKAIRIATELGLDGVLDQLAGMKHDPKTMEEFLLFCFTQKSVEEEFIEHYTK